MRPTPRGAATLGAGAAALAVGYGVGWSEALVIGSAGVLLGVIGLLVVRLGRPRLDVVRGFSPPVAATGSVVRVSLAVRNLSARPSLPGQWNDSLPWWEPAEPQPLPGLASAMGPLDPTEPASPGSGRARSAVFRYELRPTVRGVYPVGPLAIEHTDAFGMARSVSAQGETDELTVVPAAVPLPGGSLSTADAEGTALLVQRRVLGNDDDLTTREYRRGDALRRVHWRASARHGELMVRQEEQRSFPEVRVLLDTRRDGYPDVDDHPGFRDLTTVESDAFEWAIVMFASLAVHLLEQGFHVAVEESAAAQVTPLAERWEGGAREEGFLASLAAIHLVDVPRGAAPSAASVDASGPVFAVLGGPGAATVDWVRRRRRPGEVAVAFLAGWGGDEATRALTEAGWLCVPVEVGVDPVEAWAAAHERLGARRDGR